MIKNYLLQHPIHTDQNTELPQSRDHHDRTTMTVTTMTVTTHRSVTATTHRSPRTPSERPTAHRDHPPPRPLPSATTMTVNSRLVNTDLRRTFHLDLCHSRDRTSQKNRDKEDPNNETHESPSISARPKSTNAPFGTMLHCFDPRSMPVSAAALPHVG